MLACTKDSLDVIRELVLHSADLQLCNKDGWNALHLAARFVVYAFANNCIVQEFGAVIAPYRLQGGIVPRVIYWFDFGAICLLNFLSFFFHHIFFLPYSFTSWLTVSVY